MATSWRRDQENAGSSRMRSQVALNSLRDIDLRQLANDRVK